MGSAFTKKIYKGSSYGCEIKVTHLEKLLDDFSEEVRQGGGVCNGGVGRNGCSILTPLLSIRADESIEQ